MSLLEKVEMFNKRNREEEFILLDAITVYMN